MHHKLKEDLIDIYRENGSCVTVPTESVAAAYAGAAAAKNLLLMNGNPLTAGSSFRSEFLKYRPDAIRSTNKLGLATTFETMEVFRLDPGIEHLLKEQREHADNPYWPFFDED